MATWNNAANDAMQEAVNNHYVSNAEAAQLRSDISSWADMIGNERKKRFDIRNTPIEATAEYHVVRMVVFGG
jgi:hypothetical protein